MSISLKYTKKESSKWIYEFTYAFEGYFVILENSIDKKVLIGSIDTYCEVENSHQQT